MMKILQNTKILLLFAFLGVFSCDEDEEKPGLRAKINYSTLTPETPYNSAFVDASGTSTVDLADGNIRHKMFYSLNNYMSSRTSAGQQIQSETLNNMFSNTGNPFYDISTATISIDADQLNQSGINVREVYASSRPAAEAEAEREWLESHFAQIEVASNSITQTASPGQAGMLESRLVDARGIELAQVIQKGMIGGLQLDYISNVLLDEGLTADNSSVVGDQKYTQLEHNWDEAYGLLTLNPVYLEGSTDLEKGTSEFGAGSYIWEYNRANYAKIYPAFLKGRAAIVNNDKAELQAQATFIRTEFEKTLASAALGYLEKWKTDQTDAARAHHIAEGLGFIYSLRFATIHGADAAFSDGVLDNLIGSANGYWDLTADKVNSASQAIKTKFGL